MRSNFEKAQDLRSVTGLGMKDCLDAINRFDGEMFQEDKAKLFLSMKSNATAYKRKDGENWTDEDYEDYARGWYGKDSFSAEHLKTVAGVAENAGQLATTLAPEKSILRNPLTREAFDLGAKALRVAADLAPLIDELENLPWGSVDIDEFDSYNTVDKDSVEEIAEKMRSLLCTLIVSKDMSEMTVSEEEENEEEKEDFDDLT